ncbi:uncharacterized protein IWZ02DRAFT_288035 [Phyllosticta citriasiana]|uniref:Wax synthase domain-containing protein n=1 Tax=Phyllosticta citriasiana TaxID=595635 RepID=A0ABR1KK62_9PEZI
MELRLVDNVARPRVPWNWQSSRSPKLPAHITDRRSFLLENFKRGIYCWIMRDNILFLLETNPFRLEGRRHTQTTPLYVQIAVVWLAALHTQYSMSFMYRIVLSILVAVGVCSPEQCPPLFGSFRQMYTVGNLWGICWQQMMRRVGSPTFSQEPAANWNDRNWMTIMPYCWSRT